MSYRVSGLPARLRIGVFFFVASALVLTFQHLAAHSIDYVGMSFNPSASAVGGSGNWSITDPVTGGSNISFGLTYSIITNGNTTSYPKTVTFSAETTSKPAGASDAVVTGLTSHTFTAATGTGSSFTDNVAITAPTTPGAYSVKISGDTGPGGQGGLGAGNGIVINFTVAEPSGPGCQPVSTVLHVADMCILLHRAAPVDLQATLTAGGAALSGKTVTFSIDGTFVGQAVTDANGVATLENVDASGLGVGDHDVVATFDGDDCNYLDSSDTGNLGVQYMFIGYQQPINADGSSMFGGRTIPVKIKIADANGAPVIGAVAHVYYAFGTPAIVGTDAEPLAMTNGDLGNLMRYDAAADQYIFNWDIAGLTNGTYTLRVDLGEGECGSEHKVLVSLKKKGSK